MTAAPSSLSVSPLSSSIQQSSALQDYAPSSLCTLLASPGSSTTRLPLYQHASVVKLHSKTVKYAEDSSKDEIARTCCHTSQFCCHHPSLLALLACNIYKGFCVPKIYFIYLPPMTLNFRTRQPCTTSHTLSKQVQQTRHHQVPKEHWHKASCAGAAQQAVT